MYLPEIRPIMAHSRIKLADESGYAMVLTALGFSMLLGFMALAIDTGMVFQAKRKMQIAADAGAVAGTQDYMYNNSKTSATTAATNATSVNGYTDQSSGVTVTVNIPPTTGANAGNANDVEVIINQPVPTLFMAAVGMKTITVKARGVGGTVAGNTCIWLLDANGADLNVQGSYTLSAPSCGIYMNSSSAGAVNVTGNGGTLNALFADAVGGAIGHQTSPTQITTYTAPRTNPWGNLAGGNTDTGAGCDTTVTTSGLTLTGTLAGPGAGKTICYTNAVTLSNATFGTGTLGTTGVAQDTVTTPAGTLVFGAGVTISGTVKIFGGTIDIYKGSFNQGNANLSIIAPTGGTYDAIALMEPLTNTQTLNVQFGSGNQVLDGYIYAPGAQVGLQDNGGGIQAVGIVADNLNLGPSTVRIPSYDVAHASTTPNRVVTLFE
jgi:Flp pilus assembly protein TadG